MSSVELSGALSGRVALITGATRVARAIVLELARQGATVAFTYQRSGAPASQLEATLVAQGHRATAVAANLESAAECRQLVDHVVASLGRLDVLVNVASRYVKRPLAAYSRAALDDDLAVDLDAALWCALAALPTMRRQGGGRVINVTDWSALGRRPRAQGRLGYYVAKSCAIALTEALALEVAEAGILVNGVAAGPIEPPEASTEAFTAAVATATPLGRWGGGHTVAHAVVALLTSDFITGQTLLVDGGRSLA